jgi:hypothetical protein
MFLSCKTHDRNVPDNFVDVAVFSAFFATARRAIAWECRLRALQKLGP